MLLAFLALAGHDLAAQAVLKGRIRAARSETPLPLVEVLIQNLKKRGWTNDSGDFRISGIPIGSHQLEVRRVGFQGAVATLTVESADSLIIDLSLNALVPELEPIYVRAPRQSRIVANMEEQKRLGFGRFLFPEDLRENEHRQLIDLVRQLGIDVLVEPKGNKAYAIGNRTPTIANTSSRCFMALYIDGIQDRWDSSQRPGSQQTPDQGARCGRGLSPHVGNAGAVHRNQYRRCLRGHRGMDPDEYIQGIAICHHARATPPVSPGFPAR